MIREQRNRSQIKVTSKAVNHVNNMLKLSNNMYISGEFSKFFYNHELFCHRNH